MKSKKPLAFILKPKTIKDIIGQTHLINNRNGLISRMIKYNHFNKLLQVSKW